MRVLGQHVPRLILLLALVEFGFAGLSFLLSGIVVGLHPLHTRDASAWNLFMPSGAIFALSVVLGMTTVGLYQARQRLNWEGVVLRLAIGFGIAAVAVGLAQTLFPRMAAQAQLWSVSFGLSFVFLALTRAGFLNLLDRETFRRNVLVYGAGRRAAELLKLRRRADQRGFRITAFVAVPGDRDVLNDERVVERAESLLEFAQGREISEIVVAMDDRRNSFPARELLECKFAGIAVTDLLAFLEHETGKVSVDLVNPSWLIFSEGFTDCARGRFVSRAVDLALALALWLTSLPIMAAIALAIWLEDGGPVLYAQERVGFNGKLFVLYKFRSMIKEAEARGAPQWASKADPRVTRVGRWIRKLRLDELPQLFNVIRGDMSFVGPRPERPSFVEDLSQKIPYYAERHAVKPGLTGWAQLRYPYGSSKEDALEKLKFDLYYIKHQSLLFDLIIVLQTLEVVLWSKGAR